MSPDLIRRSLRTLRKLPLTPLIVALESAGAWASAPEPVTRCGWFDNPTPGNVWLHDRDGEWQIGIQGGHQAEGAWPAFSSIQWVRTGSGSAGYGCVCMKVFSRADAHDVTRIVSARARPLSICRKDSALKGAEPENPLK